MEYNKDLCLQEIKKYDWLRLGNLIKEDEVAELVYDWINTHKYFMNEGLPFEVSFNMASHSWYETVYRPMYQAMVNTCLIDIYPKDMQFISVLKDISNTHYTVNTANEELGLDYVTYEDICRYKLFETKGFWLAKIRCILLSGWG